MNEDKIVLVVDDEVSIRNFLTEALSRNGYRVFEASDGRGALQICEKRAVDLVVVDLVMPGQEGIETIQILRRRYPVVRIVAISGAGFADSSLKAALLLGANAAFKKPFDLDDVLRTAERLLEEPDT